MSEPTPVLILGATGYIGGSVLARLLSHQERGRFLITALVRSSEKAEKLRAFGIDVIEGSTDNQEKLEALASQAHVVFSIANCNNVPAMEAVLSGIRKRHETTGDVPIIIHTSGTQVINDDARGMYCSDLVYDDIKPDQIEALPSTQPHRPVDIKIVEADAQGYLKSYIVIPGTVYGIASGPFIDAGIQNPYSIQVPLLIKVSLARGRAPIVGKGLSVWTSIHIDELADFFLVLFNSIWKGSGSVGHGREGYFFTENGEYAAHELSRAIGEALVQLEVLKDPEPVTMTDQELIKYAGSVTRGNKAGANARCRGTRSRALGWTPVKTTDDLLRSVFPQAQAIVQGLNDR